MYTQRVHYYPTPGKEAEIRPILEDRVKGAPRRNVRSSLSQQMFAADGPVFVITNLHQDIASFEKARDANQSDPAFRTFGAKVSSLVRQPSKIEFFNVLVQPGGNASSNRYTHRILCYPDLGKGPIVRRVLEELVKTRQAEGRTRVRLTQQLFAPTGQVFIFGDSYANLTEYENNQPGRTSSLQAAGAELYALSRAPMTQELYAVLIPFPR